MKRILAMFAFLIVALPAVAQQAPIKYLVYSHHHDDHIAGGHPFPGGSYGTKEDVLAYKQYLLDPSEAVRVAAGEGKCWDKAMAEVRLPKYEKWVNYAT